MMSSEEADSLILTMIEAGIVVWEQDKGRYRLTRPAGEADLRKPETTTCHPTGPCSDRDGLSPEGARPTPPIQGRRPPPPHPAPSERARGDRAMRCCLLLLAYLSHPPNRCNVVT